MPANLTPQYKEAEHRFRQATTHEEKLDALREMLALLPKHKGTEKIQADLRRRLAKLEEEGDHAKRGGAQRFDPGHVRREGAGQWVLIGPPNAGKSALVRALTHAHPEVAPYPFTTRAPLPGMMPFEDVQVQLVDTPAVAPNHTEPYLANLVHAADGVILVLDVTADDVEASVKELGALLERARVWPASRPSPHDASPLLAVKPVIAAGNKCDLDPDGVFGSLAQEALGGGIPFVSLSAEHGAGLEDLRPILFRELDRIRIYAKEPGKKPDMEKPFVLKRGATVHDLARIVHKELAERIKYARIWGSARFDGEQVNRDHALADRDVVELHA
ncbi:MAG: 50S ribosome-binding GTPase [Candidatus Latescibacteria bacterium]|nr:50S ribosome-binding GTPase [Candidatus Latescibacterota bacterium]